MTTKEVKSHPAMLQWQYRTIMAQLDHVFLHASDGSCPCNQVDMGRDGQHYSEYCLGKHLNDVNSLCLETAFMDAPNREWLEDMAEEALDLHNKAREIYCAGGEWPDLAEWAREGRKKIEAVYYSCRRNKVRLADPSSLFEPPSSLEPGRGAAAPSSPSTLFDSFGSKELKAVMAPLSDSVSLFEPSVATDLRKSMPEANLSDMFQADFELSKNKKSHAIKLSGWVDTGASLTRIPLSTANRLGLERLAGHPMEQVLDARGRTICPVFEAYTRMGGKSTPDLVWGIEQEVVTIGAMTLEKMAVKVNPLRKRLEPAPARSYFGKAEVEISEEPIAEGLRKSVAEELEAARVYEKRARVAYESGDYATQELYKHVIDEERQHYREFKERLGQVEDKVTRLFDIKEGAEMQADLAETRPKEIVVYPDTIEYHYRPSSAFHKGSIRTLSPNAATRLYIGCLKSRPYEAGRCSATSNLKMIVRKSPHEEAKVKQLEAEGVLVRTGSKEMETVPRMGELVNDATRKAREPELEVEYKKITRDTELMNSTRTAYLPIVRVIKGKKYRFFRVYSSAHSAKKDIQSLHLEELGEVKLTSPSIGGDEFYIVWIARGEAIGEPVNEATREAIETAEVLRE